METKKILYFVGHYDYLIYSMLYDSAYVQDGVSADFIVAGIRNDKFVKQFIRKKRREELLERFTLVDDEKFLNLGTEKKTVQAICRRYDAIFRKWDIELSDYAHIYMSFDEWNSFGIYLEQKDDVPPVSMFVKYTQQLEMDIYHYLDTPGKYEYSNLQKKYRVLNAGSDKIGEVIVLEEEIKEEKGVFSRWRRKKSLFHGKPVSCFSLSDALDRLPEEKYEQLCAFFQFDPVRYQDQPQTLLLADSNWFGAENGACNYEYLRAYQMFLNYMIKPDEPLTVKKNPRYHIANTQAARAFQCTETLPVYVPAELLAYRGKFPLKKVISIGNPIPECLREKSAESVCVRNSFFRFYKKLCRFSSAVKMAGEMGYGTVYCYRMNPDDMENYRDYFCRAQGEVRLENASSSLTGKFIICNDVGRKDFQENIMALIRAGNIVVILNPERCFGLISEEQREEILPLMYAFKMKKYRLLNDYYYSRYEDPYWVFCNDSKKGEQISYFTYSERLPFSGYMIKSARDEAGKQNIICLSGPVESKEYVAKKAKTSPVIIYGASSLAYEFLNQYGKMLNVRYVMTDSMKYVDKRLRKNYEVVKFRKSRIHRGDYVIICKSFIHNIDKLPAYAVTRDRLLRMKYRPYKDFTYYRIFEAGEENRQIMLFCGYCEMSGIKQVLELTSAVRDYCMLFYHIGRETMEAAPGYRDFIATAKACDILVHAPLVVNRGVLDEDILQIVSPQAQKIFIPQISFRGYAPYKAVKFGKRNTAARLFGTVYYPFLYEIPFVNEMIEDGRSNEEILEAASSPELYGKEEIEQNLQLALRMLEIMDSKSDIPIHDYIIENFRKRMLFKDSIHPNDELFFEYARKLSLYLNRNYGDEIDEVQEICRKSGAYFQVATEEPILPCVAKHLQLEFADENKEYMMKVTEEHIRMKTFREWITDYCDYYRSAITVKRTLNPRYQTRKVTILRCEDKKYCIDNVKGSVSVNGECRYISGGAAGESIDQGGYEPDHQRDL